MRFGVVHRFATDALAALAVLSLLTSGLFDAVTTAALLGLLLVAIVLPSRVREARAARRATATALVLALTVIVAQRGALLATLFEVLALILVARIASRRGAQDDTSLALLSLLGFVAASLIAPLAYAVSFLGLVVVAPVALTLSHLRREVEGNHRQGARDRSGMPVDVARILRSKRVIGRGFLVGTSLLGIPILAAVLLFFAFVPRFTPNRTAIGLNDAIDLSSRAPISTEATPVLRFETSVTDTPPDRLPLRFRGATLTDFDGQRWRHRSGASVVANLTLVRPADDRDRKVTIDLDAIDPPLVLLPPGTVALAAEGSIERGLDGELRLREARALHYVAWIGNDSMPTTLATEERARALALPSDLPARIRALAHAWADDAPTDPTKARAIEDALKRGYRYNLTSPARTAPNAIDAFLFEARTGHCELFASSMAIMLRELGIPSRVVTGFLGGERNRFGSFYAVRQRDAHAWVEAYVDGAWRTYDPTPTAVPPAIDRDALATMHEVIETLGFSSRQHVIRYDDGLRTTLVAFFAGRRGELLTVFLLVLLAFAWRRSRATRTRVATAHVDASKVEDDEAAILYRRLEEALARKGIVREPSMTPLQLAVALEAQQHPDAGEIRRLTEIYLSARFGGQPITEDARSSFLHRVAAITS